MAKIIVGMSGGVDSAGGIRKSQHCRGVSAGHRGGGGFGVSGAGGAGVGVHTHRKEAASELSHDHGRKRRDADGHAPCPACGTVAGTGEPETLRKL